MAGLNPPARTEPWSLALPGRGTGPETPRNRGFRQVAGARRVARLRSMPRPVARIQDDIRRLSAPEKEEVLRTLLEELDGPPDADVEAAWLDEAERRAREFESGQVQAIPGEEVFRELDKSLAGRPRQSRPRGR